MIKRYFSNYTGEQIDEAVQTIVDNAIQIEDLSPELIAEIKKWINDAIVSSGEVELLFGLRSEFPEIGSEKMLYIATDEHSSYFWKDSEYVAIMPNITLINCGGAQTWQS